MPENLSSASGRTQDQGHSFFPYGPTAPVNNIFIFSGRVLFKVGKEIGIKDIAYVASHALKKRQIKKTKENNVSMIFSDWLYFDG